MRVSSSFVLASTAKMELRAHMSKFRIAGLEFWGLGVLESWSLGGRYHNRCAQLADMADYGLFRRR